ncbi:MAG TPA: PQQ-binding-like beta-propeller repeat protein [Candidatus Saccharimonadales bacterium]|nr:PQQ-binding-like beta-propeller repeat protein [Candidatus Saccharimonadales bacterium]
MINLSRPRFCWLAFLILCESFAAHGQGFWPEFRGPGGLSVAPNGNPPVYFGTDSNVVWKVSLPSGNSSPAIWGNRIFVTGFDKQTLETICLDRATGSILWRHAAPANKIEPSHNIGSPACPTPATDGSRVYVYFGSFGLLCYDMDGKEVWRKPIPMPIVEFGSGTSPILAGDRLILNCDQDMNSFLLAVDKTNGKEVWRTDRSEFRRGFATPLLWQHDGVEELVVPGSLWLKSYDPGNGHERWTYRGTSRVACSSPVAGDNMLFSASWNVGGDEGERITMQKFAEVVGEYDKNKDGKFSMEEVPKGAVRDRFSQIDINKDNLVTEEEWNGMAEAFAKAENAVLAIRAGGRGDITKSHLAWKQTRSLPYVSSPLYYQGRLHTIKNGGLASAYEAKTGKVLYQDERLGAIGDYYSSAVAAQGRIYAASQKGMVVVFEAADYLNVIARNDLHENVMSTPAVAGDRIYYRTANHLFAFGE